MVFSETNLRKLWDEFNFLPFCSPREAGGRGGGWLDLVYAMGKVGEF